MLNIEILLSVFIIEIFLVAALKEGAGKSKLCIWVFFIQFFIVFALRDYTVLCDTDAYYYHYNRIKSWEPFYMLSSKERFETGYLLLERFTHNVLELNFLGFQIITTLIILGVTMWYIYRNSSCTWFAIFIFVVTRGLFSEMIAVRQGLAIAIGLLVFSLLKKDKYIWSVCVIFVAAVFHTSALFLLILIPIYMNGISIRHKEIFLVGSTIIAFTMYGFFANDLSPEVAYSAYAKTRVAQKGINLVGLFHTLNAVVIFMYAHFLKSNLKREKLQIYIRKPDHLVLWLYVGTAVVSIRLFVIGRLLLYFLPVISVYISNLYADRRKTKYVQLASFMFCCIMICSFLFVMEVRPEWTRILPYKFYNF